MPKVSPWSADSPSALSFEAPLDSREHRLLRGTTLELPCLGAEGVCRYCFGRLSGKNAFALDYPGLLDALRSFLGEELPERSARLCEDLQSFFFFAPYLRNRLHVVETGEPLAKRSKEDRAIDAVLRDPMLTDEEVRELLKTTEKQMRRWSTYGILRRALDRSAAT